MKHNLLSLIALAGAMFTSTSAVAVDLVDPVAPTKPAYPDVEANWVAPEAGGTYFIYNVGAGQFLGCGNDWGTRAVTTIENLRKVSDAAITVAANKNYILPFAFSAPETEVDIEGTWVFITHLGTNKVPNDIYLAHEGNAAWVDAGTSRRDTDNNGYWRIEPVGDNAFQLRPYDMVTLVDDDGTPILDNGIEQTTLTSLLFGVDGGNMGNKTSNTWTDLTVSATHFTTWKFLDANHPEEVEAILNSEEVKAQYEELLKEYDEEMAIYRARVSLKEGIGLAEEAGLDIAEAVALYNNADATAAQLKKADAHLRALIIGQQYDFSGASDENPLDVTDQVLTNPTFDTDINGWTITVTGQNLQWQNRTDGKIDESKNWVQISQFIEAWIPAPTALGDGTISQTVYGLPKGKYILECDAMATLQGGSPSPEEACEGAYIFIEGEESEVRNPIKSPDTQPKHWSVIFISDGSDYLTFGLKVENTTANWISADNFKLTYYGETDLSQAQLELDKAIKAVEPIQEDDKYGKCYAATLKAFEDELQVAKDILNGDLQADEVYTAEAEKLTAAYDAMKASMKAYDVLLEYYSSKLPEYITIAGNLGLSEIEEEYEQLQETWEIAYDEGTMTDAEITEKTAELLPKLKAAITPESVQSGADLTWLLENPSFDNGTEGWTVTKDGGNTGTVSVDDNIDYHEVEFWRSQFDLRQTIANMPAGVYEITVQGFSRNEDDQENPNSDIKIEMYAGDMTAKFMNVCDLKQLREIVTDGEGNTTQPLWTGTNGDRIFTIDGVQYYGPNGMGAASAYFATENPQTGEPFYTNHVKVTLMESGDFTIGVRSFNKNEWTLFDNFKITYLGTDCNLYSELLLDKVQDLENAYAATDADGEPIYITAQGENLYNSAKQHGTMTSQTICSDETPATTFATIIKEIEAAISYLNEGAAAATAAKDLVGEYVEVRLDNTYTTPPADAGDFLGYIQGLDTNLQTSGTVADNDALKALPEEINTRWTKYVMEFAEENPYTTEDMFNFGNATEAIYNPRFESYTEGGTYNTNGWTIEKPDSVNGEFRAESAVAQTYNATAYKVYQTVKGLKPGYYMLTVDGFYRAGFPADMTDSLANVHNASMFANTAVANYATKLKNVVTYGQAEKLGAGDESTITLGESVCYIPNNTAAAFAYVDLLNAEAELEPGAAYDGIVRTNSLFRNDLFLEVGEDGELTLGITNKERHINGDWTIFSNWTLTLLPGAPDAIQGTQAKQAAGINSIFTVDGRQSQKLQRGINIVRNADGSVQKVLVK